MTIDVATCQAVVGYILLGASGDERQHHEAEIHSAAAKLGCAVAAIVYARSLTGDSVMHLKNIAWGQDAAAIITPNYDHLTRRDVDQILISTSDVIYLDLAQRITQGRGEVRILDLWNPGPNGNSGDNWNVAANADDDGQDGSERTHRL